ncbi:MAG: hypothetical protein O2990_02180, partial [Bacteroidetes bacterium]|nr:hypothetical protein [Bacteroidota bacterium]
VGALDECGICNGPGAIYECGCSDIPAGDCDCNGNQLDALGVCGGDCDADVDSDGICDDVDDCVGAYDACGICNGPGEVYECGCSDIPEGDCDCNGNQLDALGVCGGDCDADANGNGVCDDAEVLGCMNACACNYNADASQEDGSCEYTSCSGCIYATAINYNDGALLDDGSCAWEGCMNSDFLNFNSYATSDAGCTNNPGSTDLNGDGEVDANDLIDFLTVYGVEGDDLYSTGFGGQCVATAASLDDLEGSVCEGCCPESGCMYSNAMNYDPTATLDAGSCVFGGCTDAEANNYNALANVDDGSCLYQVCPDFTGDGDVDLWDFLSFLVGYIGNGPNVDSNDEGTGEGGMNTVVGDGN